MNKTWYIFLLIAVLSSCRKKDFPESSSDTHSDFYFKGTIDGTPVSLTSGVDDYYMHTAFTFNDNKLYGFVADLKPTGCNECRNSLQIKINDFKYSSENEPIKIDSSLSVRSYPLRGVPFYAVQFRSIFNKSVHSCFWTFGDNTSSRELHPLHLYSSVGNYSVSLRINSTENCQQYISNVEKIRYPAILSSISVLNSSANTMKFSAFAPAGSSYLYEWNFGDGGTSTSPLPSHTYSIAGTYPVTLRLITKEDTVYSKYYTATQTNPMPCLTNYKIESVKKVFDPSPLSGVVVKWTDENGDLYTSEDLSQPESSFFKILSVDEYDLNEKGEKTKKIKISFSCKVYKGSLVKTIDNAEAVVGVSYK